MSTRSRCALLAGRATLDSPGLCVRPQVQEGEARYQVAWHYQIPYPRLHHGQQVKGREVPGLPPSARS